MENNIRVGRVGMTVLWGNGLNYAGDEIIMTYHGGREISAVWLACDGVGIPLGRMDWAELPARFFDKVDWDIIIQQTPFEPVAMFNIPYMVDGPNLSSMAPDWAWAMWEELSDVEITPDYE